MRGPTLPDTASFELPPDWVCEVLSPSTTAVDRAEKMPIYARERIPYLWLVDPVARTMEACRLENGRWTLLGTWRDDARVRVEPFAELELELGGLWAL
jgi:Uma2 family endonuclease